MGSAPDEASQRLMKQTKTKPGAPAPRSNTRSVVAPPLPAVPSAVRAAHLPKPLIPAGFFDDSLADAKARNVDVQQVAKEQLESDWAAFEAFAAKVETQSVQEEHLQAEEMKEREAVEQLENMQYVDRYRLALERVTRLRNGEKRQAAKRKMEVGSEDGVEQDGSCAAVTAVNAYKKKKHQQRKKQQQQSVRGDALDDLDPCNWRCRGW